MRNQDISVSEESIWCFMASVMMDVQTNSYRTLKTPPKKTPGRVKLQPVKSQNLIHGKEKKPTYPSPIGNFPIKFPALQIIVEPQQLFLPHDSCTRTVTPFVTISCEKEKAPLLFLYLFPWLQLIDCRGPGGGLLAKCPIGMYLLLLLHNMLQ